MAFTDNPTVQAMMQATGLDGQLASSGATPGSPIGALASSNIPKSPQMRPEYQEARPPVNPRFAGPQEGRGQSALHVPGTEPGLIDASTLQSPTVHDLLAHYGVTAPTNIDDHLFIHDPEAFKKHPLIANMIERGLGGLANYHTGRDTAETLSNIAGSVVGNDAMHAQAYNNRAMAPIMQAQQIGSLMENQQRMALQAAQQKHDNSMADYYNQLLPARQQIADTNADARRDVATTRANGQQAASPVQAMNNRVLSRVNTLPGNTYTDMKDVPPDVWSKAYTDQLAAESTAKSAGALGVKQAVSGGTRGGKGGIGSAASNRLDQGAAATDKDLVGSIKAARDQYQFLDSLSNMPAAQRTLAALDPHNSKYGVGDVSDEAIEARKQQLAKQAGQLHTQRASLYARHGMSYTGVQSDTSAAPAAAPSNGNPFR
jgi:hypothetical protein